VGVASIFSSQVLDLISLVVADIYVQVPAICVNGHFRLSCFSMFGFIDPKFVLWMK